MGLVMTTRLKNRHEGGRLLARLLADYAGGKDVVVLAIASGGAPVAAALARELVCPMDVLVVRTLNVPQHNPWELEMVLGAVAPGGVLVYGGSVRNPGNITLTNIIVLSSQPVAPRVASSGAGQTSR